MNPKCIDYEKDADEQPVPPIALGERSETDWPPTPTHQWEDGTKPDLPVMKTLLQYGIREPGIKTKDEWVAIWASEGLPPWVYAEGTSRMWEGELISVVKGWIKKEMT